MNAVDGSDHYEREFNEPPPALLTIVLDTNPHAWTLLSPTLTISKAICTILIFINAHLAFNNTNQIALVASHSGQARWLYPATPEPIPQSYETHGEANGETPKGDTEMVIAPSDFKVELRLKLKGPKADADKSASRDHIVKDTPEPRLPPPDANKYRPFREIEDIVMDSLRDLIARTEPAHLSTHTTLLAGALSMALAYISRATQLLSEQTGISDTVQNSDSGASSKQTSRTLQSRVLIISVSSDSADQYIPIMNSIFAAQRKRILIDVLKLHASSTFLQQASDATSGIYLAPEAPSALLQYLMIAYLPDQTSRQHLISATQSSVDFRAACFCHKNVVDVGFVCSICLSIFCEPPEGAICLTCGTHLALGNYGAKPAVVPKQKKKKKKRAIGSNTGSRLATPQP